MRPRALIAGRARCRHGVVYGVSANRDLSWRNPSPQKIGWTARKSSQPFRANVEVSHPMPGRTDVQNRFHGGRFAQDGLFENRPA
jgi:uronate dehydrogenase